MRSNVCQTPRQNLFDLGQDLDSLFFRGAPGTRSYSPPVDVVEAQDAFLLTFDLPGIDAEAVEITFDGEYLVVKGEKVAPEIAEGMTVLSSERRHGAFERKFRVKTPVDSDAATAESRDGILHVRLPKAASAQIKTLSVKKI